MTLYLRTFEDFSYEIIYVNGFIKKKRLHVLINPSKHIKLRGSEDEAVLNQTSLTHIVAMETSVKDPELLKRTVRLAENTNKPVITNKETAEKLKEMGMSVRQLRIIGFESEVVEGLNIDPVYKEELAEHVEEEKKTLFSPILDKFKLPDWLPFGKLKEITPFAGTTEEIDPSRPIAFNLLLGKQTSILLPVDKRGIEYVPEFVSNLSPHYLVIPNQSLHFTKRIPKGAFKVVIINESIDDDQALVVPKTHNPGIKHDTIYGSLNQWIEI